MRRLGGFFRFGPERRRPALPRVRTRPRRRPYWREIRRRTAHIRQRRVFETPPPPHPTPPVHPLSGARYKEGPTSIELTNGRSPPASPRERTTPETREQTAEARGTPI